MINVWFCTLMSVFVVSLISLVGVVTLSFNRDRLKSTVHYLVSFAVGALFGDALIHLLPEAASELGFNLTTSLLVILGLLIFFVLEKFLHWQHCHIPTSSDHIHPVCTINLVGDAVHNFMDGVIIAASFLVSIPIGITTTLAVILHEIPQEIGDFGIYLHKGMSVKKALTFNFLSALTSVAGAVITLLIGAHIQELTKYFVPITAGGFLYIAGSDLIPELHHGSDQKPTTSLLQFVMIVLGVAVMASLTFLE
jgi:zinc and cadmium transporter